MWLCSEEVEENPRLHTLHLKGLLELQEKGEQVKTWPSQPEDRAWLPVRLQVDLQVVGAGEGGFALLAAVLLITCGREDDSLERRRAEKQRGAGAAHLPVCSLTWRSLLRLCLNRRLQKVHLKGSLSLWICSWRFR